jgi:hypothetical protein
MTNLSILLDPNSAESDYHQGERQYIRVDWADVNR